MRRRGRRKRRRRRNRGRNMFPFELERVVTKSQEIEPKRMKKSASEMTFEMRRTREENSQKMKQQIWD